MRSRLTVLLPVLAAISVALLGFSGCGKKQEPPPPPPPVEEPAPPPAPEPAPPPVPAPAPVPVVEVRKPPAKIVFRLPTVNDGLFRDEPAAFYMFTDRYVEKQMVQKWEGGSYGFVRTPRTTKFGEVFTQFHEGIDIAPVARDAKGEPQDTVHAIGDGVVAYCTAPGLSSNYGNYVIVAHDTGEGIFCSLYAHLRKIAVSPGKAVKAGELLGEMGYTGRGIDRRRAHVHLELCVLLSERYDDYYRFHFKLANGHGNYNGQNLAGLDVAKFLRDHRADPSLSPADFLAKEEPYFHVLVPNKGAELGIAQRYPKLRQPGPAGVSWEVAFSGTGVPLAVRPSAAACTAPVVSKVKSSPGYHQWNSRNLLTGSGDTAGLSREGARYVQLVTGDY